MGGSHKVAFNYAIENNFDYIIVLHGDDQGSISDMIPVLKNGAFKSMTAVLEADLQRVQNWLVIQSSEHLEI